MPLLFRTIYGSFYGAIFHFFRQYFGSELTFVFSSKYIVEQLSTYLYVDVKSHHESQKWKWTKAWFKAEPLTAEGKPINRLTQTIGYGVADITADLMRIVGAQSGWRQPPIPEQPRGDIHGSGRLPKVFDVCHAFGGRSQMPQMQEHRLAWFPSWEQHPHHQDKEELEY